jgi:serine/threonine protein kinase
MLLVNQILHNRYRIMRQLGHGGMGAVYEVHDNVFDTTCALKEIMLDLSKSSNSKQQEMLLRAFEREAMILAKIKHEVVPHVRDYFTQENRQYLVMELIEGKDLGELLEERKTPFPLEDVMRWMEQLLDGLDYLHTQNPPIFHRDLKPQNLKLTPRGKIKLLDFGIAKGGTSEPPNSTTINNQTFVAATLNYSPIEQIFRVLDPVFREVLTQRFEARIQAVMQQNADARSDLYALGATVYHLLTGFLPLDALKRTIEVWSNKPDPLDHPTKLNSHIPPEISNVLLKAMELDHNRRYSSAIEMQQAMHRALADIKQREENQAKNTLEMSGQAGWSESERLRQIQAQQQTRLGTEQTFQDAATQQIPAEKLPPNYHQGVSEETIQSGALGYSPGFGSNTGGTPPPTPNSPHNTGGNQPFNTGGQYPTGGNVQPTEMANFAGVSTGGNVPPPNYQHIPVNTGGAMNSNNPLSPNVGFAQNYAAPQPKKSSKIWWVVPILLLMFLGVAAAGGGLFLWYQANSGGTADVTPTPTAATSPSVATSASKTPTTSPSASPTDNLAKDETPKPTVDPTTRPVTNTPAPIKTPPPVQKTPKKTTPKKNSDCIFSGDC